MSDQDHTLGKLSDEIEWTCLLSDQQSNIFNLKPRKDDPFEWHATIVPNEDSIYAGGIFELTIRVYEGYPERGPMAWFQTPIYHPNVGKEGHVNLFQTGWNPKGNLLSFVYQIADLIDNPDTSNCYDGPGSEECLMLGQLCEDDPEAFEMKVQEHIQEHASGAVAQAGEEAQVGDQPGSGEDNRMNSGANETVAEEASSESKETVIKEELPESKETVSKEESSESQGTLVKEEAPESKETVVEEDAPESGEPAIKEETLESTETIVTEESSEGAPAVVTTDGVEDDVARLKMP